MRVSTKNKVITPTSPQWMSGYIQRTHKSTGVYDDFMLVSTLLEIENELLLFVNLDTIEVTHRIIDVCKKEISSRINIKYDNIIIAPTHTHSGPTLNNKWGDNHVDVDYEEFIIHSIIENSVACINDLTECKLEFATTKEDGLYGNRNSTSNPEDKELTLYNFLDFQDNLITSIISIACHSTVLNHENYLLSTDLLGGLRHKYYEEFRIYPIMALGAAGDMSNRLYRKGNNIEELEILTSNIYTHITSMKSFTSLCIDKITVNKINMNVLYEPDLESIKSQIKELESELIEVIDGDRKRLIESGLSGLRRKMNNGTENVEIESIIYSLGDLVIVTVPGELSAKFGLQIKEQIKPKMGLIWGYVNKTIGYMIPKEDFESGSHEANATKIPIGITESLVDSIINVII